MPPRQLTFAIVVGWLASSGWLFQRELWPNLRPGAPPPYTIDLADEAQRHVFPIRWAILRNGKPIGHVLTQVEYRELDDTFQMSSEVKQPLEKIRVSLLQLEVKRLRSQYRVSRDGELRGLLAHLEADIHFPLHKVELRGEVTGKVRDGRLECRCWVESPGFGRTELDIPPVPVAARASVLNPMHPVNRVTGLRPGQRWRMPLVDPLAEALTAAAQNVFQGVLPAAGPRDRFVEAEVAPGPRSLIWNDAEVSCLVIDYRGDDQTARTWVRQSDGLVLRQEARGPGDHLVLQRLP